MSIHVSDEQIEKWYREIALVRLTEACPYCDGPIETDIFKNPNGEKVADWQCEDCADQWIALVSEIPGTFESDYQIR